jgi:hypothetical protein
MSSKTKTLYRYRQLQRDIATRGGLHTVVMLSHPSSCVMSAQPMLLCNRLEDAPRDLLHRHTNVAVSLRNGLW